VEGALALPVILTLACGTFDLGRLVADQGIVTNETNVGITQAIVSVSSDVGTPIRNESSSVIVTTSQWGYGNSGGQSGTDYDCTGTNHCGDPSGCVSGSTWWQAGVVGCYSVGYCTLTSGASASTCDPTGTWGATNGGVAPNRPAAAAGKLLAVRVTLRFTPITPFVKQLQPTGSAYVTRTLIAQQTY
jgi:hypothetical protein